MPSQVPYPISVNSFSPFAPQYDIVIDNDGCLSTVGNNSSKCSVGKNSVLNKVEDASATKSSNVRTLDSGSFGHKGVVWSNFVISMYDNGIIEFERISSEVGTPEGSIGVSESKIQMQLENGTVQLPFGELWICGFYLYQRAFPETQGAGI